MNKNTPWSGGYAAINSFGFGGANVHAILRSPNHPKCFDGIDNGIICGNNNDIFKNNLINGDSSSCHNVPRLIMASGRTEEGVTQLLEKVKSTKNEALFSLMDRLQETNTTSHPHRGCTVVSDNDTMVKVNFFKCLK